MALAADTPSYNNGDCWQAGTPTTCTWNHLNRKGSVYFRAIDRFSVSRPGWSGAINNAVNAWNSAPGPQYYSFTPAANDVWIYIYATWSGQYGLDANMTAITWLCDYRTGLCSKDYPADPVQIWYVNVYLNWDKLDTLDNNAVQSAAAHESGHGMGLAHNLTDANSVMKPGLPGNLVPNSSDWGYWPGCANGGQGTNCIYGG
jgi:hypothetical protein